jgi:hypothetical protein
MADIQPKLIGQFKTHHLSCSPAYLKVYVLNSQREMEREGGGLVRLTRRLEGARVELNPLISTFSHINIWGGGGDTKSMIFFLLLLKML